MITLAAPFQIGQTYWLPRSGIVEHDVPCPACFSVRTIRVTLGNGEELRLPCSACHLDSEGSTGVVRETRVEAHTIPFTVADVVSFDGESGSGEWRLRSTQGDMAYWSELRAIYSEAAEVARIAKERAEESRMISRQRQRKSLDGVGWSVHYHRKQIRQLEQQIRWHRTRLGDVE